MVLHQEKKRGRQDTQTRLRGEKFRKRRIRGEKPYESFSWEVDLSFLQVTSEDSHQRTTGKRNRGCFRTLIYRVDLDRPSRQSIIQICYLTLTDKSASTYLNH